MIVEELARNIVQTPFQVFGSEIVEQAKNRIIDIVGCAIAGANAPGCPALREVIREWGGTEQATILAHGDKAPAHNVAMVNSVMARSYDHTVMIPFVGSKPVPSCISGTTVPTALSVAEWKHSTGKELITALILGDDLTTRLLIAPSYYPGANFDSTGTTNQLGATAIASKSFDSTGTANKFGATAIACKLMGLDERQTLNAFGIVMNKLAGSFQCVEDGVHAFKLIQGLSSRDGVVSAELASKGFLGVKDALESKMGYFALYRSGYDADILTENLGKEFYADATFKPYPSCRLVHSSIDCALELVREQNIDTSDIAEITVNVAEFIRNHTIGQPFVIGDFPQGNATFSLRYAVANVLLRKCVRVEHYTEEFIRDPEVVNLTGKVNVIATLPSDKIFAAEVSVKMNDGRELSRHVDVPKGDPIAKPLTKDEIEEKFWSNVAFSRTVSRKNAASALALLNHLEELDDISQVIRLLVAGGQE